MEPPVAGNVRTVLFADMKGSTALTRWLTDAKAREVLGERERIVRAFLRAEREGGRHVARVEKIRAMES